MKQGYTEPEQETSFLHFGLENAKSDVRSFVKKAFHPDLIIFVQKSVVFSIPLIFQKKKIQP